MTAVIFEVFHLFTIIDYFLDHGPYFHLIIVNFVLFLKLKYKLVSELSLQSARLRKFLLSVEYGDLVHV